MYDFSKHKKETFNQSSLWNIRFDGASSKVINTIATTGILGVLSLLALMGMFVFYGVKFLFRKTASPDEEESKGKADQKTIWMTGAGVLIAFAAISAAFFLYSSNLTIDLIFFMLMGSLATLMPVSKKEFILKPSSLFTLGVTFVFTIVFIFGLGFFILEGQRYSAEISYLNGLEESRSGKADESLIKLERAARVSPKMDIYWRELSQIYLSRIGLEAARTDLPRDQVNQRIKLLINNAVNSGKTATDINPNNVANWSIRAFVYNDLIGVVGGVDDWAIKAYDEALKLEPTNPYYPAQKGISLLRGVSFMSEERSEEREERVLEAKAQFERAIELKSDYAPARFQLAMIYQAQGNLKQAVEELEKTKSLAPFDVGLAFQLGLIYFQDQNYDKAQLEFERAIVIDPNYANALYFLGLTYDKQGEAQKAISNFERVAELNPGNLEIRMILDNLKAGKGALEGIIEEVPPLVPIEDIPPEGLEEEEE
jgi:tetratricopeptide (TPR) repeat protein